MSLYPGSPAAFPDDVYLVDETDLVLGGPDGTANKSAKNLADRTAWLKDQVGRMSRLEGEVILTASAPIPGTLAGNLIVAYASTGAIILTLADAATFLHGAILPLSSFCEAGCVVNVQPQAGQPIFDTDGSQTVMHMHHKEKLWLVALTDHWKVLNHAGNFYCAGEEVKARKERINTLALKGQIVQRAQFPRLWKYVQTLTMWQEVVDETLWFYDATTYRGCFSTGDGVSTFRLPDERAMSDRMLDLGRGIDFNRNHNFPGGYEKDLLINHFHNVDPNPNSDGYTGWGKPTTGNNVPEGSLPIIKSSGPYDMATNAFIGSNETTVKNIGKLNLIKF